MNCQFFAEHLGEWLDNELSLVDAQTMAAHCEHCGHCWAEAESLRGLDRLLGAELTISSAEIDHLCAHVLTNAPEPRPTGSVARAPATHSTRWLSGSARLGTAAAVGFLAAWLLIRMPRVDELRGPLARQPFAVLSPIIPEASIQATSADTTHQVRQSTSPFVSVGCAVTAPAEHPCEMQVSGGGVIRLDHATRISVESPQKVQLQRGKLWFLGTRECAPVTVQTPHLSVICQDSDCHVTVSAGVAAIDALRGAVRVESATGRDGESSPHVLMAGQRMTLDARQQVAIAAVDPLLLPSWMDRLLALKGPNPELHHRVAALWQQLTPAGQPNVYETELRKIGISCSGELASFLCPQRPDTSAPPITVDDEKRRERAAMILADVVDYDSAQPLVQLLADNNPGVRYHAARGLARVAGHSFNETPADWRAMSQAECELVADAWRRWLDNPYESLPPRAPRKKKA
ncbi:MAG: hypothetical protein KDA60_12725 [Planctomycetales bacterium]|nr:hypothetical protein [Planctomycetales bacterium]